MKTKPKKKTTRVPYFSSNFFETWRPSIESALSGKEIEVHVNETNLTELSLFTQIRSVLRYAEQKGGLEGAGSLKAYRRGEPDNRYIVVKKFEAVRPVVREVAA